MIGEGERGGSVKSGFATLSYPWTGTFMQSLNEQIPIISYRYVKRFFEFMDVRQVHMKDLPVHESLFKELFRDPEGCISVQQLRMLSAAAEELLNDEKAGFEFGQQLDLSTHGLLGYTVMNAENPIQLIETIVNHVSVSIPLFRLKVRRQGHGVVISVQDLWDLGDAKSLITKIYLGSIYEIARSLCQEIRFECAFSSLKSSQWTSLTGDSQWHFDTQFTQVVLPEVYRPSKPHQERLLNNGLYTIKDSDLSQQSPPVNLKKPLTRQIHDHVMQELRYANIEKSAQRLNMSTRHLRKRLAQEGTSFREISTNIRKQFAATYLKNTPLSINEIGLKLGFGDQSSFTRAYQRWTGETPGAARKHLQ